MTDVRLINGTCTSGSDLSLWCGDRVVVCRVSSEQPDPPHLHLNGSLQSTGGRGHSAYSTWLGLALALMSAFLIGGSVILKKKALLRLAGSGHTRAGDGGHGYLKDLLWWGGLLTMGAGEVCNFAAYMFAPATLVTPLGALSVLISALLSCRLLGERLNLLGKLGCLLCVLGSVLLVIHAPQEQEVTSLEDMTSKLLEPGFLVYLVLVLVLCVVLVLYFCPRAGRSNILVYISVCSLLGAFTVSSVKGLAIAITTVLSDRSVLSHPLTWILLPTLVVSVVTQVNYLNKSLDCFGSLLVYPLYYVLFTSVVLLTCVVLFQEWSKMAAVDVVTALGAFLVIVVGVAMLHLFRDLQVSLRQLTSDLSRPLQKEEVGGADRGGGASRSANGKEDRFGLMDNMVIESLPPMREEGPRVFIIS